MSTINKLVYQNTKILLITAILWGPTLVYSDYVAPGAVPAPPPVLSDTSDATAEVELEDNLTKVAADNRVVAELRAKQATQDSTAQHAADIANFQEQTTE